MKPTVARGMRFAELRPKAKPQYLDRPEQVIHCQSEKLETASVSGELISSSLAVNLFLCFFLTVSFSPFCSFRQLFTESMSFINKFTASAYDSLDVWSSPDRSLTPSGGSEGVLPRGGISSGKEVGLVLLNLDKEFVGNNARCGGQIGAGSGKLCIKKGCDVASHKKKHKLTTEKGVVVCIEVKHQGDAVFGAPVVHLKDFDSFDNFKDQLREVEGWESLFNVVQRKAKGLTANLSREDVDELEFQAAARTAATPFKTSSRKLEAELELEEGFEMISSFVSSDVKLEGSDADAIKAMRTEWDSIVTGLAALKDWAAKSKKVTQATLKELHENTTTFQLEFLNLQTVIGERPADLPRESLFDLIKQGFQAQGLVKNDPEAVPITSRDLSTVIQPIQTAVASLQALTLPQDAMILLKSFAKDWLAVDGLTQVFQTVTKDRYIAAQETADLKARVTSLELQVAQLLQQGSGSTAGGVASQFTTSAFVGPTVQASNASSASISNPGGTSNVDSRLKSLETSVGDLKAQSAVGAVSLGRRTFASQQDTQAWLTLNVKSTDGYLLFVDLHSFFAIIKGVDSSSPQNFAKSKAEARKAGFASESEAAVASSFERDLPVLFGIENTGSSSRFDTREMPALPSFEEFGTITDPTGFSTRVLDAIDQTRNSLISQAENKLTGDARRIAEYMISRVAETANLLIQWMAQHYSDLKAKGTAPKEAWRLVTQSVRSMFTVLHQERQAGRSVTNYSAAPGSSDDHRGFVVWGCMQGFKRLEEVRKHRFANDPSVYQALFHFLQDETVLKSQFEEFKKELKRELDKIRTELSKKQNK